MRTPHASWWKRSISNAAPALAALACVGILLGLALSPAVRSQEADDPAGDPKDTGFVERAAVSLSLLEVVVLDNKGRHVRGLKPEDFRLVEGGAEVEILTLDEIDLSRGAASALLAETPAEPSAELSAGDTPDPDVELAAQARENAEKVIRSRLNNPRWFVMLFDGYYNPSPRRIHQVRKAAKNWVLTALRPTDRVAVYEMTPWLRSVSGFTGDVFELQTAIASTTVFPADEVGLEFMRQKMQQAIPTMPRNMLESQLLNAATFGADLLEKERDQFYRNFLDVIETLRQLEGTRAVVLFSGGFPMTRSRATSATGGFSHTFRFMISQLEREGIRVFTFDVGDPGTYADAEEQLSFTVMADNLNLSDDWLDTMQIGSDLTGASAHTEILAIVGNESGGRFMKGYDYARGLTAVNDDLSHYYLIGYQGADLASAGRKHVSMRVKMEQGKYKAVARTGRFADPGVVDIEEKERSRGLVTELETAPAPRVTPALALTLSCRPQFFPGPDGKTLTVLPIRVAGPVEATNLGQDELVLDVSLRMEASSSGEPVLDGDRDVRARMGDGAAVPLASGFQIRDALLLPAGAVLDLALEVTLNGQDRSGSWNQLIQVPTIGQGFGLTDLTLLAPADPALKLYDVFDRQEPIPGTEPAAPLADPLGAQSDTRPKTYTGGPLPRSVPLLAQIGVLSPPPAPADGSGSPLRMDWVLVPVGGGEPSIPPIRYRRLQLADDGRLLDVVVDLQLGDVPEGDYELRLTTENLLSRETVTRSIAVTLN